MFIKTNLDGVKCLFKAIQETTFKDTESLTNANVFFRWPSANGLSSESQAFRTRHEVPRERKGKGKKLLLRDLFDLDRDS